MKELSDFFSSKSFPSELAKYALGLRGISKINGKAVSTATVDHIRSKLAETAREGLMPFKIVSAVLSL